MRIHKILCFIFSIFFVFMLTSCSLEPNNEGAKVKDSVGLGNSKVTVYPLKIKDSYNREITIEKEPARVISAAPNITEIIFSLKKQDKLVGRTAYCDYPEDAKKITSIGDISEPSIEKIVELKPDLVIASSIIKKEVVAKFDEIGIKIVLLKEEKDFSGVYDSIERVGEILNAKDVAKAVVSDMKDNVNKIAERVKNKEKVNVYYVLGYGKQGDFTAGKDTFISKIIDMAGGKNIADDTIGWQYSIEKIIEKNPKILICSKFGDAKKAIANTAGYKDLEAVKKGNLFEIDDNLISRQGPRLADGFLEFAKIIHPEAF